MAQGAGGAPASPSAWILKSRAVVRFMKRSKSRSDVLESLTTVAYRRRSPRLAEARPGVRYRAAVCLKLLESKDEGGHEFGLAHHARRRVLRRGREGEEAVHG